MNWRLRNEDGTWVPMMQGQQGVMMVDDSEESEDEEIEDDPDYHSTYLVYCVLVHYENQQFLNMENEMFHLRKCGLIK